MGKLGFRLLALVLVALLSVPMTAQAVDPWAKADAAMTWAMQADSTLGMAVAVYKAGELVHTFAQGTAVRKGSVKVTDETLFRVASVTKLVTALGVMGLVEQGLLDLDADVGVYLGYPVRNPRFPEDIVTLRQLMSHTAGLMHNADYAKKDTKERLGLRAMLYDGKNVRRNYADRRPGKAYEYSNFGAGVVGSIIEAVTGESLQAVMERAVFVPLGIQAYYHPAYAPQGTPMATGYRANNMTRTFDPAVQAIKPLTPGADPEDHYDLGVGGLMISPQGLARLGAMLASGGSLDGVAVLSPESAALMRMPQSGLGSVWGETPNGLGVQIRRMLVVGRVLYGHQGSLYDTLACMVFDPVTGTVVAMATNATAGNHTDEDQYALVQAVVRACFAVE